MKFKTNLIIFLICVIFGAISVSAENGSILLSNDSTYAYSSESYGGTLTKDWTKIYIYVPSYNYISNFRFNTTTYATYTHSYESSTFSISSGGVGTGIVYYDRSLSRISWVFSADMVVTSSPLILSYTNNIFLNVSMPTSGLLMPSGESATQPVKICTVTGCGTYGTNTARGVYEDVHVSARATDTYIITYPMSGYFAVTVLKNPYLDTKYRIEGLTSLYSTETTYNKVNIYNATFIYADGIVLNASLNSGVYTKVWVNLTTLLIPTTGTIGFNQSAYASTSGMNFTWSITSMNTNFGYIASLYDFNGVLMDAYNIFSATGSQNIDRSSLSMIGEYTIKLIQIDDTSSPVIRTELDSDTAYWGSLQTNVSTPVTGNFSILNNPVMQGAKVNITYNITTEGWLELYDWTSTLRFYIDSGANQNIQITIPENYKVGTNSIRLRYTDRFTDQNILLWLQTYTVLPSLNYSLTSERALYVQGELMKYYPYSSTGGYAKILSPSGIMVNNISITAYGSHVLSYQTDINSEVGTYTASLYNASGLLTTKGIYLNYGMQGVTPTVTATATATPVTLIDITSELSTGLLGSIDSDEDGLNSNDELSGFGNKILSTLVLIVLALLISGIFTRRR